MNTNQARQIDIVDFLNLNHIQPIKQTGDDYWYISPYREEKTASFKVNRVKNLWYDHGAGEGGNIIDLVLKIENCNVKEALSILEGNISVSSVHRNRQISLLKDNTSSQKQEILRVTILSNIALLDYIKSRNIDIVIAKKYLLEIYYRYDKKNYFALAFKNDSGGYEIRSKYFKGTIGTKNITTIKGKEKQKNLFVTLY